MTLTRTEAAAILHADMQSLAAEVRQTTSDAAATGYGPDLDKALRRLGTAESSLSSATVADSDVPAFLALARYYALSRFAARVATKVDTGATAVEGDRNTIFDNVKELLDAAAEECAGFGYPVDKAAAATSLIALNLDFLEPEPTSE